MAPLLSRDDPQAKALAAAIRGGDLQALRQLLDGNPQLANARIQGRGEGQRTPLHIAADWPGYFPNAPRAVEILIGAGADPSPPSIVGRPSETPLHWAASSDDVDVAAALIAGGADIEAPGASIAGGSPLDDAVGYGCWRVAQLLLQHGAKVERLWLAAALGLLARMDELFAAEPPTTDDVNHAFYQACSGGQRRAAEYLYAHGADPNWIPDYAKATPLEAATSPGTGRKALATWLHELAAKQDSPSAT